MKHHAHPHSRTLRNLRWIPRLVIGLTVLLSLTTVSFAAEPLRIGYIGSLTGDAAAIGSEIAKSLEVRVSEVNSKGGIAGRRLELIVEDDHYEISKSLSAYEKIKGQINSHIVFMSTYGALFALGARPEKDGIIIVDTLDCNDALVKTSGMHTCVATRTETIAEGLLGSIARNGGGQIGVIYEEEAWFNFILSTFRSHNAREIIEISAPVQSGDYRAQLLTLKAKGVKHIVFLGNDSMGRALKQARDLGITARFYATACVLSPGFQALAGEALDGTVISNWEVPQNERYFEFAKQFEARHHQPIQLGSFAGPTADAATLIIDTLRSEFAKTEHPTPASIRSGLSSHTPFDGISGSIVMDKDGAVRTILETTFRFEAGKLIGE